MSLVLAVLLGLSSQEAGDSVAELLKKAAAASRTGDSIESLRLANKAVSREGQNVEALLFRASLLESLDLWQPAFVDLTKLYHLKGGAEILDRRGSVAFKLGMFQQSLRDFDKFLELRPKEYPGHWRRGITCYYAGKFEEGKKQFEGYEQVDTNDVENAVWRYLCMAKRVGVEKARVQILKIGRDKRKPMMEVYALFAGKATPEDVLKSAKAGDPGQERLNAQLFYAHLYLGLFWDAQGNAKKALEHLEEAVEHRIGHYMWDVARVHRDVLKKAKE